MIEDRRNLERGAGRRRPRPRAPCPLPAGAPAVLPARRQRHRDLERPDSNELVNRRTPGRLAREVDDVKDDAARLFIEMAVDEAGAFDGQRDAVAAAQRITFASNRAWSGKCSRA